MADRYLPPDGVAQPALVEDLCDELLFDAYPWQVLGPGHLARLDESLEGATPLAGGRMELAIGEVSEWLSLDPEHRTTVQEKARRLLAPCLISDDQAFRRERARRVHTET